MQENAVHPIFQSLIDSFFLSRTPDSDTEPDSAEPETDNDN